MIKVIPDISVLYQMVNFLVLLFVLNLVLYKPIRKVLLDRKAKIEGMQKEAKKASSDLVAGEDAYKDGLSLKVRWRYMPRPSVKKFSGGLADES